VQEQGNGAAERGSVLPNGQGDGIRMRGSVPGMINGVGRGRSVGLFHDVTATRGALGWFPSSEVISLVP
jgi:hypothetical protein